MRAYLKAVQMRDQAQSEADDKRRQADKARVRANDFAARAQELWRALKAQLGDRFLDPEPAPRLFPVGSEPKQRVLRVLRAARGALSGRELAKRLGLHVSRVSHVVRALRADGVPIRASHAGGYWLAPESEAAIGASRARRLPGRMKPAGRRPGRRGAG